MKLRVARKIMKLAEPYRRSTAKEAFRIVYRNINRSMWAMVGGFVDGPNKLAGIK